jgi:hypothetical protein
MSCVAWHSAESNLDQTQGDVLCIFDCCNAGRLCQYRGLTRFEYLGACSAEQTTPGPGSRSFTTALIWALRELHRPTSSFPTSELQLKITEAPNFSKTQRPPLGHRIRPSPDHIRIAPLGREPTPAPQVEEGPSTYEVLELRFHFKDTLTDEHIIQVADELSNLIASNRTNTKAVSLIKKHSGQLVGQLPAPFTFLEIADELYTKQKYGNIWQNLVKKKGLHHGREPSRIDMEGDELELSTQPSTSLQHSAQANQQSWEDVEYSASPAGGSSTPSSEPPISSYETQASVPLSQNPRLIETPFLRSSTNSTDAKPIEAMSTRRPSLQPSAANQQVERIRQEAASHSETPDLMSDVSTSQTSRDTTPSVKVQPQRMTKKRASTKGHGKSGPAKKAKILN